MCSIDHDVTMPNLRCAAVGDGQFADNFVFFGSPVLIKGEIALAARIACRHGSADFGIFAYVILRAGC
jgi:hypothetical protein